MTPKSFTSPRPKAPPVALASLPDDWIETVREIVRRDGVAVRAGFGACIEVQSINTGEFYPLLLPGGGVAFASAGERDEALARIEGRAL